MDDSLYDEYGNYIDPKIESDQDSGWEEESDRDKPEESNRAAESDGEGPSNGWLTTGASVDADMLLAEGKKYYPTAEEVYSEDVETLVMDEDKQLLKQPIIKPVTNKKFEVGVNNSSTYVFEPSPPSPIMEQKLTDLNQASRVSENPLPSSSPINLPSSISHKYTTTLASISLTPISSLLHQHCSTKFPNQNFSNQYKMYVVKRHRHQETVHFDKITAHLKKLSYGLSTEHCDPVLASRKVCAGVYRGVTTSQLDELAAETAVGMTPNHPDYASLAAKTAVSNLHKHTKDSFSETLIASDVYEIIIENAIRLDNEIIYDRVFYYDYFGFKNLDMSSLLKVDGTVFERPQHMIMRVSVGIHKHDIKSDVKTYHLMSQRWFTHASPTLFNVGTPWAKGGKNQKVIALLVLAVRGWNLPVSADEEKTSNIPDCEQYKSDFPEEYTDAKFFVIKSYSEDDIHKSIKYHVWASTVLNAFIPNTDPYDTGPPKATLIATTIILKSGSHFIYVGDKHDLFSVENKNTDTPIHEACRQENDNVLMLLLEVNSVAACKVIPIGKTDFFVTCYHGQDCYTEESYLRVLEVDDWKDSYATLYLGNWKHFAAIRNEKRNPKLKATHLEKAEELFTRFMIQHSPNLYDANGAAVVFAKKGHFEVSKDIFTQVQKAASGSVFVQIPDVGINVTHVYFSQGNSVVAVLLDKFFVMEYTDCVKVFDAYASSAKKIKELVIFYNWCADVVFRFPNAKELAMIRSSHPSVLLLDTHYGSNISGWILFVMVVPFKQWDPE